MLLTTDEVRARGELIFAALNERDFDTIASLDFFDNERSEFHSAISDTEGGTYVGLDGLRDWARATDEVWEDFSIEQLRLEQADDRRWVVELRNRGRGRGSGIPIDLHTAQIWSFDANGVLVRNESFTDVREAFEAAGVPY